MPKTKIMKSQIGRSVKTVRRITASLALILLIAGSAVAHHSFAMFDHTKTLTLRGSVTKFQWTNPHAYLEMDVTDPKGAVTHYSIECTSINMMQRAGWRSNMIKAGDKVKAIVSPLINGEPAGLLLELTLPDGKVLEPGVPGATSFKRTPSTDDKE